MSISAIKPVTGQAQRLRALPVIFGAFAIGATAMALLALAMLVLPHGIWGEVALCVLAFCMMGFAAISHWRVRHVIAAVEEAERSAFLLAGHDPLSGLPNRRVFKERLENEIGRMKRSGTSIAVLFLDLDKFKEVNDTFGHGGGDRLIVEFAERMNGLLRGADTLARLGGDEFAIIQTDVRNLLDVEALARRILAKTRESFALSGGMAFVGVSIGIALSPEHSDDADMLMRLADVSLYQSKNDGRNRYSIFARQLGDQMRLRKVVEDELRETIEADKLSIAYQPIVSSETTEIAGFEALVRWPHERLGMVPPSEFVPIAESSGLINALGEWVLRRACQDARHWPETCSVSVNVSPIQFKHKDFVATVAAILADTGISPNRGCRPGRSGHHGTARAWCPDRT
jgi:diguanylate cyclase